MAAITRAALAALLLCLSAATALAAGTETGNNSPLARVVQEAVRPVMAEHAIPGMAVGVTVNGTQHIFTYGVASKQSGRAVTPDTLFEVGSVSKTLTATLGSYAQATGALSLAESASTRLPALADGPFEAISLLHLATYTAGGLPLQFPESLARRDIAAYFAAWQPRYAPGTYRQYSNPSIGLFGHLAAQSLGQPFAVLMEKTLFPALGMTRTYLTVPKERMADYAQGYTNDSTPVRLTPGVLDAEAYGVKTTLPDLLRFAEANMDGASLAPLLRKAITETHTGYFSVGPMTQCLGWERYPYPTSQDALLAGNAPAIILEANPVTAHTPPLSPKAAILLNKTGSTNGFGTYVVLVPQRRIGIVLLANKNYPIPDRIKAAYRILTFLEGRAS